MEFIIKEKKSEIKINYTLHFIDNLTYSLMSSIYFEGSNVNNI
jgi:hypothetical protein